MLMKKYLLENSSKKIIEGILKSGTSLIISFIIISISLNSNSTSEIGHYISITMFLFGNIIKWISCLFILKFICSFIQKILNFIDKI